MEQNDFQDERCDRCGECCRRGGPSLHRHDLGLLLEGHIRHDQLLCIRKGEWAMNPLRDRVEPADREYLKIRGKASTWECCFYSGLEKACGIYDARPVECRLLSCRSPERLLAQVGVDVLTRMDLLNPDDPVRGLILRHEEECSFHAAGLLLAELHRRGGGGDALETLTDLVRKDLWIRREVFEQGGVDRDYEYFLFGRPLFISLGAFGVRTMEEKGEVFCSYSPPGK